MTTYPLLLSLALCLPAKVFAANETVLTIAGSIYAAIPCVINGNRPITAAFGDVQTASIDGHYKTITLDYGLSCPNARENALRMQVSGSKAGFDNTVLAIPSHNNLGVALKMDGNKMAVGDWFDFDAQKPPVLQAVLVKVKDADIKEGPFRSSATLLVDYR